MRAKNSSSNWLLRLAVLVLCATAAVLAVRYAYELRAIELVAPGD